MLDLIKKRRSIRRYTDAPVSDADGGGHPGVLRRGPGTADPTRGRGHNAAGDGKADGVSVKMNHEE